MAVALEAGQAKVLRGFHHGNRAELVEIPWISSAGGLVTITGIELTGKLTSLLTVPDGALAPSDNYDIALNDEGSQDVLETVGANRHTTTTQKVRVVYSGTQSSPVLAGTHTLAITSAGAGKRGKLYLILS